MKKVKMIIASLLTAASFALVPVTAGAITVIPQCSGQTAIAGASQSAVCASKSDSITTIVKNVISVLFEVIGALSVIMIIYGGIRYVTSAGNAASVTAAKNTIMYALIGLVVAVLAVVIVNFVITGVTTGKTT